MPSYAHPRSTGSTFRILYLGSDLEFIAAFRKAVSERLCRLAACADQESAALFLKSDISYDLMLIDHDWRGNEGLKQAQLAHSQRHRKQMPIVLVSAAKLDQETETLAENARLVECVLKSSDMSDLVIRMIVAE